MAGYIPIALAGAVATFVLFRSAYLLPDSKWRRWVLVLAGLVLAGPAVAFLSNYIAHVPRGEWFVSFRSLPGAEASSGLVGALLGATSGAVRGRRLMLRASVLAVSTGVALAMLMAPFAKQALFGLDYGRLENRWVNGVCLQTSPSTCMPASCATVIRLLGGRVTEPELAREAGTSRRGTEVWYMMRALRRRGFDVAARVGGSLRDAPAPCIVGVTVGRAGHVVAMVSRTDAGPEISDPLGVRRQFSWKDFEARYRPDGDYLVVRASDSPLEHPSRRGASSKRRPSGPAGSRRVRGSPEH